MAAAAAGGRELDVVVYGATGFTGELVCEYLCEHYPANGGGRGRVKWGVAARSPTKLLALMERLVSRFGSDAVGDVEVIEAEAFDRPALDAMVARTRVVASTAGPFLLYGDALVGACASSGTHYVDITGETVFVRRNYDQYHEAAVKSGARIISCCGYDSVPSEVGAYAVTSAMIEEGRTPASVEMMVGPIKGGMSGGTVATMCNVMDTFLTSGRGSTNKLYLNSTRDPDEYAAQPKDQKGLRFSEAFGKYTIPFMMAMVNTRIVRRSNELRGLSNVAYSESVGVGSGWKGYIKGVIGAVTIPLFFSLVYFRLTRWLLYKVFLPHPGQGPSREKREAGFFTHYFRGLATDGTSYSGVVHSQGDPGYKATSMMLTESALCLALQPTTLPDCIGVVSPAAALGSTLVDRLRRAGMTIDAAQGDGATQPRRFQKPGPAKM